MFRAYPYCIPAGKGKYILEQDMIPVFLHDPAIILCEVTQLNSSKSQNRIQEEVQVCMCI